jgi:GNAT superfamily N-acetyltransferase
MTAKSRIGLDEERATFSRRYAQAAEQRARLGPGQVLRWTDLSIANVRSPIASFNQVTLLRPLELDGIGYLARRLALAFGPSIGPGYRLFSAWPCPDLHDLGLAGPQESLCMVRARDGDGPEPPAELRVIEVSETRSLRAWEAAFRAGFGIPVADRRRAVFGPRLLKSRVVRLWLGLVDDVPVSCAAAYVMAGAVCVDHVATVPGARRRGYGSALAGRATGARPDLPAILEANELGRPVYERLGYRALATASVWRAGPGRAGAWDAPCGAGDPRTSAPRSAEHDVTPSPRAAVGPSG